jgi:tRNA dimethylallyltransferase
MVQDGLAEEVRRVWELGYGPELAPLQTIGYAQIGKMLQGHYGLEEALEKMAQETRRLAKRQLTWLRAEPDVRWFAPTQTREIAAAVAMFFEQSAVSNQQKQKVC